MKDLAVLEPGHSGGAESVELLFFFFQCERCTGPAYRSVQAQYIPPGRPMRFAGSWHKRSYGSRPFKATCGAPGKLQATKRHVAKSHILRLLYLESRVCAFLRFACWCMQGRGSCICRMRRQSYGPIGAGHQGRASA